MSSSESGFSLLEVMAAIAVLGFTVAALLKLASVGLTLAKDVRETTALVAAADGQLRAAVSGGPLEERPSSKEGLECDVESVPYEGDEVRDLMKITVTARDKASGASYTLTTLKER
ncbi:hypothetical protein BAC1_00566 [uncultured bacterium]|nr:hypothetical protein BAC1_00566 [uncultured bacterium]